jgi:hypothetical protein
MRKTIKVKKSWKELLIRIQKVVNKIRRWKMKVMNNLMVKRNQNNLR